MKFNQFYLLFVLLLTSQLLYAQKLWTEKDTHDLNARRTILKDKPTKYKVYHLDTKALKVALQNAPLRGKIKNRHSEVVVPFPTSEGVILHYRVMEAPVMDKALSKKYPEIKSYAGQSIEDPSNIIRFSVSQLGIKALILSPDNGNDYIQTYTKDIKHYMIFNSQDRVHDEHHIICKSQNRIIKKQSKKVFTNNADDGILRTYRIAVATNGEYTAHFGGTIANALAAINATMTTANALFERDFNVTMTLVNNTNIIYTDASTDPFSNDNNWAAEVQADIDSKVGDANYDIGHLFAKGDGGGYGCIEGVCSSGDKASAYSADASEPSGYGFDIDLLTHEFGHQFGANHTWTHNGDEGTNTQMEPGSGSTNMSYAGITGATDVQDSSDDYFHAISIQQVTNFIKGETCHTPTTTGNNVPVVNAGSDYVIPRGTPFILTGTATDMDGDALTYCWEQTDENNAATTIPSATATTGVAFRSRKPTSSNQRSFPELAAVRTGSTSPMWEVVPEVGRTLNFRLTVRDNQAGGGTNNSDDMMVTVDGSTGPFKVSIPNSNIAWPVGSSQTITWDVAGSAGSPINTSTVNILLSTDSGNSFPTTLVANTANDGSETITIPNNLTDFARIKIEAVGNIFYDISDTDFTIGDTVAPTYCVTGGVDNSEEFINGVSIGTINNTTGASSDGYEDNTSTVTDIAKGSATAFTITPGFTTATTPSEGYAIFIDLNKNGVFTDAGEQVFAQAETTATSITGSLTVPTSAITGTTRMRISMAFEVDGANISSCGNIDYGEVEDYTVNLTTILPVEWNSFTVARSDSKSVTLSWSTSSEHNTAKYIIERSDNGTIFSAIATTNAAGTSSTEQQYHHEDLSPLVGDSYYRIKQIDLDGSYSYSEIIKLNVAPSLRSISLYPNPLSSNEQLNISSNVTTDLTIEIFDITGKLVLSSIIENGSGNLNITNLLSSGLYFYKVNGDTLNEEGRLVIE